MTTTQTTPTHAVVGQIVRYHGSIAELHGLTYEVRIVLPSGRFILSPFGENDVPGDLRFVRPASIVPMFAGGEPVMAEVAR